MVMNLMSLLYAPLQCSENSPCERECSFLKVNLIMSFTIIDYLLNSEKVGGIIYENIFKQEIL